MTTGGLIMELTTHESLTKTYSLAIVKSFVIWTFTLGVCLLVVGFPLIVLMVTIGSLLAIALHPILPVTGSLVGANVLAVVVGAAVLTFKGIHPSEVRWLSWLHGEPDPLHTSVYAACPLTCDIGK